MSAKADEKLFQNNFLSDVFHFVDKSYATNVVAKFCHQRSQGRFLDVTLKAGASSIVAHRSFLAAFAEYFEGLFTWSSVDSTRQEVEMKLVDGVALGLIIDFAYTGELDIMSSNVTSLLETANYIGVDMVKNACCRYLLQRLSVHNATDVMILGSVYGCHELYDKAKVFAVEHFEELSESPAFLELDPKVLCDLVSDDRLVFTEGGFCVDKSRQEWLVLQSVLQYATYDEGNRAEPISDYLLPAIHLSLITPELIAITRKSLASYPRLTRALNVACEKYPYHREAGVASPRSMSGLSIHLEVKQLADTRAFQGEGSMGFHDDINAPPTRYIIGMEIYVRRWDGRPVIGGLRMRYSSGEIVQLGESSFPGGSKEKFLLEGNERIVSVTIRAGWMIDSLTFDTSLKRRLGPYGGTGGAQYVFDHSTDHGAYLGGVQCRIVISEGVSCIRNLSLVWASFKYSPVCDTTT